MSAAPMDPHLWVDRHGDYLFRYALRQCLSSLPARCADTFVLREMEAMSSDRIQELLGISASNFWVLMHRARMQLRLCLEQNWLKT